MADIEKITKIVTMVLQILFVIGAVGSIITGIVYIVADLPADKLLDNSIVSNCGMVIASYGLPTDKAFDVEGTAMIFSGVIYGLMAMIVRNINLIVRTAEGGTWFSQGSTPFQEDNVRMIREIGIFCIAITIVGFIGTMVAQLVAGTDIETSSTLLPLIIGVVVIFLSKIFEYGKGLQEAEDGLI